MSTNRIYQTQPDYLLVLVRKPPNWQPAGIDDFPPVAEPLSMEYVASYEEAYDDLERCNTLSIERGLDTWAVIQCPEGGL